MGEEKREIGKGEGKRGGGEEVRGREREREQ